MTDLRAAAQALLDAIDAALPYAPHRGEFDRVADSADDLRDALAQQAEPAPCDHCSSPLFVALECRVCRRKSEPQRTVKRQARASDKLRTGQVRRKPKTPDELRAAAEAIEECAGHLGLAWTDDPMERAAGDALADRLMREASTIRAQAARR